jgi:hypothetical protein
MATAAQIAANRANAQKSTGPRTFEGKGMSRFNALKHGLDARSVVIPGEDPDAYCRLAADYLWQFQPDTALEEFHVATLIRCDWQKRRLHRTENKLYRALLAEGSTPEDLDIAILRDSPTANLLRKVIAQIAALERSFFRALTDLRRIHRERNQGGAAASGQPEKETHAPIEIAVLASFPEKAPSRPAPAVPDNPALRL